MANIYYVDFTTGDDGDTGLTEALAWKTMAKVNAASLSAGDSVLFKRGETWREQLTVPSSGSAGSPITFGAYGTGANPIINGADLVTTWTAVDPAYTDGDGFEVGDADLTNGDGAYWSTGSASGATLVGNDTVVVDSGTYSAKFVCDNGSENAFANHALAGADDTYVQARIYIESMTANANDTLLILNLRRVTGTTAYRLRVLARYITASTFGINMRVDYDGGDATTNGSTTFNVGQWYTIEGRYLCHASTGGGQVWVNGALECSDLTKDTVFTYNQPDLIRVGGLSYGGYTAAVVYTDNFKYHTSYIGLSLPNVWQAACTTEPSQVYFDGTLGTKVGSAALCNGANKWFWAANILYVYYTEDPDGAVVIEASARLRGIYADAKDYITIDGIDVTHTLEQATPSHGAIEFTGNSDYPIVQNCTVSYNGAWVGIYFKGTSSTGGSILNNTVSYTMHATADRGDGICLNSHDSVLIDGNTIHHNESAGILLAISVVSSGNTISNNIVYQNGAAGISLGADCASNIIEYNHVYENSQLVDDRYNIDLYQAGNNNAVRYNMTHDGNVVSTWGGGIRFDGGSPNFNTFGSGNSIYYNKVYNELRGIRVAVGANGATIYNNIVYNSSGYGLFIGQGADSANVIAKNNLIAVSSGKLVGHLVSTTDTIDNNCYYDTDYTNKFYWNGTDYSTFADWKTASSQDAHSVNADPLFTNPATSDFTLQALSPCINAGVDVGLTRDYEGTLVPQGAAPDMGAYEFYPPRIIGII